MLKASAEMRLKKHHDASPAKAGARVALSLTPDIRSESLGLVQQHGRGRASQRC